MTNKKIVFVSQEMAPYLPGNEFSTLARDLALGMHKRKHEVRTFMPKFADVNERRNQLHEVIRLSGINIPIDDSDHPLIIKVASLQPARIQVYFIDNDDFFQKEETDLDYSGPDRTDNDERAIFFARGTAETIRKLKWVPGIIHVSGWMASVLPVLLRHRFEGDPAFAGARVVFSVRPYGVTSPVDPRIIDKLIDEGVPAEALEQLRLFLDEKPVVPGLEPEEPGTAGENSADTSSDSPDDAAPADGQTSGDMEPQGTPQYMSLFNALGVMFADAVIFETRRPDPALLAIVEQRGIPYTVKPLTDSNAEVVEAYADFYNSLPDGTN